MATKTINDVYIMLFRRFKEADSPQPALEARELTAYACKADKRQIAEWGHVYLDDETVDYANLLCDRCLDGEPLAYLLGEWDFYGLTFRVSPAVLIPRQDTEALCEMAILRAQERMNPRVLDLCAGSGCIGLALLHEVDDARVTAIDLSEEALDIARDNAKALALTGRYIALRGDVKKPPQHNLGQFDIIVSNPPYITAQEMKTLDRSVAAFEPTEALYGGEDGLDFYHAIVEKWSGLLVPGGILLVECGYRQATQVASIFEEHGLATIGIAEDRSGIPRIVYGYAQRKPGDELI